MKILGGVWKGLSLKHPHPTLSRPTQERVKKSLFDMLGAHLEESRVLDLFSGSGTLGLEALSRGAQEVTCVEWDPLCMRLLKENLKKLRGASPVICLQENALKVLGKLYRQKKNFDIIFMDPPYLKGVTTKCLRQVDKYDILTPDAILVIRHSKKENLPVAVGALSLFRQKRYGETTLSFYQRKHDSS
ncbi:MAG: 16S rRNA (guanine(966)-N(2))-methyltransferase RsmD [Candidatus Omnitrophica bacterium]|nr:16S rRNA (guanine(966)-N(2))-methyltransferase RsmD [Candidatus Omnitrophota bacterium]